MANLGGELNFMGMLETGVSAMGAAKRAYDKFGKRHWVATPIRDMSKKDAGKSGTDGVSSPKMADSNTKRTKTA